MLVIIKNLLLLLLMGLVNVKLGTQTRACAVTLVYTVAVEPSICSDSDFWLNENIRFSPETLRCRARAGSVMLDSQVTEELGMLSIKRR